MMKWGEAKAAKEEIAYYEKIRKQSMEFLI